VAKQKHKDKKAAEEKARQAVHARATAEVLAKQAAAHAIAMLKGEVVTQFAVDQFRSTSSSVSLAGGWQRPASSGLSLTREPPPHTTAPSRLGVPTSLEVQFTREPPPHTARPLQTRHRPSTAKLHEPPMVGHTREHASTGVRPRTKGSIARSINR
jgi:hypothetical protein